MPGENVLVIDDSPTILKVVQLVLTKAGYQVQTAPDGEQGVAAAREHKPHLILLDFVMPKMNGYQVCRALAEEAALKDIPVVLMSAKGDQIGERFVKVMGIVDYITKPFSPEAITAVVGHTIAKYQRGGAEDGGLLPAEPEAAAPETPAAALDAADAAARVRRQALSALRSGVARAVALKAAPASGADEGAPPEAHPIFGQVESALDDSTLEGLLGQLNTMSPVLAGTEDSVLAGEVRVVPLAQVLQLLQDQSQTGTLTITRGPAKVEVYFRQGRVEMASAAGVPDEFLLGRFILDNNLMAKQDLDLLLKSRAGSTQLLGSQLVKLGYITPAELKQAMGRQTSELIYEVLRWSAGRFVFRATKELSPVALDAQLGLSVEGILMEGFRRVDEWHLIEREIDNFDVIFVRNEDAVSHMGRGRLTREELAILELANGKNSVKDIIRHSRMGSFDVSKMLYRLLSIKLIRKRVAPVAV